MRIRPEDDAMSLLELDDLSITVQGKAAPIDIVHQLDLTIGYGEIVCLAGESGSGKTMTALGVTRLVDYQGGRITSGTVKLAGRRLESLSQTEMSGLRGAKIGLVYQDAMSAFDPLFSIGEQIGEVLMRHKGVSRAAAHVLAVGLLRRVKLPEPDLRAGQYPHEMSGGMLQRAMIAMALACGPELLIADEPTTALDVTIQAQILSLLKEIRRETGLSILFITHDLGVAAAIADRVVVMYAGNIVEQGPAAQMLFAPAHPYTRGLLGSMIGGHLQPGERLYSIPGAIPDPAERASGCAFHPRCWKAFGQCQQQRPALALLEATEVACWHPERGAVAATQPATVVAQKYVPSGRVLFEVADLNKHYKLQRSWPAPHRPKLRAVDGISFQIREGEIFGLVGESGSGKSTLARVLMQIEPATSGNILFDGEDITRFDRRRLQRTRRDMQMIFQDSYGSLDPHWRIADIIGEPLAIHEKLSGAERREKIQSLLGQVGLDPSWVDHYPRQLSGGQRQRVAIARAIALKPRFILADEAVSALDVSVRAQIVNLLLDLREELGLTFLFIGHGLELMRHISDRIGVMYLGRMVEIGPADAVFASPAHPYTRGLIDAILAIAPRSQSAKVIEGEIPSPVHPPPGCRFHTRCPLAQARCREEDPALQKYATERTVACHYPL
jgi:peptide/nickel transport system ATP-binding protein